MSIPFFDPAAYSEKPSGGTEDNVEELPAREEEPLLGTETTRNSSYETLLLCDSQIKVNKSISAPSSHLSPSDADLIPGKYEGGYKLWEGAIDLVQYLFRESRELCKGKHVLELGAGHAIPSILAAQFGATHVDISDYNVEVLRDVTMPNIAANVKSEDVKVRFFSGGWGSLAEVLDDKYDVILSAETIYSAPQSESLAKCILKCMAPQGTALVAAKLHYFGLGGGTRTFETVLRRISEKLCIEVDVSVAHEIRDGMSNVREILQIRRR